MPPLQTSNSNLTLSYDASDILGENDKSLFLHKRPLLNADTMVKKGLFKSALEIYYRAVGKIANPEIQKKIQAEAGHVTEGGPIVNPRWVGSGWTIFNNKGKPVRQYEPFFSATHDFEFGRKVGVSPTLFYDPASRVEATLHPNHTWEKVLFDPWRQETWDVNDTVLVADPKTDPDVGDFFRRLPDADYLPSWRDRMRAIGPG